MCEKVAGRLRRFDMQPGRLFTQTLYRYRYPYRSIKLSGSDIQWQNRWSAVSRYGGSRNLTTNRALNMQGWRYL